jgi:hypothetical protein
MSARFAANILHPPTSNTAAVDSPTGVAATAPYPKTARWGTMLQVIRRSQHAPQYGGALMTIIGEPPAAQDVERFMRTHAEAMKANLPPGPQPEESPGLPPRAETPQHSATLPPRGGGHRR